ncbi:hypothetical protein SD77_2367 [Bacillus badius]|uniref:Uncharacterized protein n=1 Tax=Bacillus badius TaxID=1455 RepID=A0ABR5AYU9_BACBA|nr:hypothetical protein SD78_2174 [Bacillus badius]KIL79913.1 hypothetical protein SD77_2367 [Bacillus badius]
MPLQKKESVIYERAFVSSGSQANPYVKLERESLTEKGA